MERRRGGPGLAATNRGRGRFVTIHGAGDDKFHRRIRAPGDEQGRTDCACAKPGTGAALDAAISSPSLVLVLIMVADAMRYADTDWPDTSGSGRQC